MPRGFGHKVVAEEVLEVKALAASGKRIHQICDMKNRSEDTIKKIIKGDYDYLLIKNEPEQVYFDAKEKQVDTITGLLSDILDEIAVISERLGDLIGKKNN